MGAINGILMGVYAVVVVRQFYEKCFNRTQIILRTVKAPNTFLSSFSETSRTHDVIKNLCCRDRFHIFQNPFLYLRSSTEMRPKAAFRCGWNRRPIHWTSEKLSAHSDVIYTVSHG